MSLLSFFQKSVQTFVSPSVLIHFSDAICLTKTTLLKGLFVVTTMLSIGLSTNAMADDSKLGEKASNFFNDSNVNIDPNDIDNYVLALAQVISEMCPKMLNSEQKPKFYRGFQIEVSTLLPQGSNSDNAFRYLSTQQDYKQAFSSIKAWTKEFSEQENKALCEEIAKH